MAFGDLSSDQRRYRDRLAGATGLAPLVVSAWIGTESGWGITKAGHNYLNIGPGRQYASVDQAAAAAAVLLGQPRYAGIRAAIPAGPAAQIKAIGESPWGTIASRLADVYRRLAGSGPPTLADIADRQVERISGPGPTLNPVKAVGEAASGLVGNIAGPILAEILPIGLGLVFAAGALVLIVLGLSRLTGAPAAERFTQLSGLVGGAGLARGLAASVV